MTEDLNDLMCPHADGVICAATLDDAAADPALTLEGAREMLRDAAAAIRHFHGLAPPALSDDWARTNVAAQQPAGDGCHCATCTCEPNMTPAVRYDLSPAQKDGAIRDHLIALGWTPPGARQPAAPSGEAVATVAGEFSEVRQDGEVYWLQTVLLKRPQQLPFGAPLYTAPKQPTPKPDAVAGLVEKAYAGCTIWRGSLRVSVTETEAIEHCIDADEAFCDLVQRALDSLAAAWDAAALATQHQEPTT